MISLTKNDAKTLNCLFRNFSNKLSMRQLALKIGISTPGIMKILKGLEEKNIVSSTRIGKGLYYSINFKSETAIKLLELILSTSELNPHASLYANDLTELKKLTKAGILFGSILKKPDEARDVDVMLIIEGANLDAVEQKVDKISSIRTKKIHPLFLTENDLEKNLREENKAILSALEAGVVLWGWETIVKTVEKYGAN